MTEFEQQLKETLSAAYEIERELGGGGMSRVFVATDRVLGRKIVIKLLSPELIADVNRGRFRREIQVAAQLQHPHIVPLLSAGEHEDIVYYTMPFIAGESLKQSVEKAGPMLINDVVRVLYHVGEALDYAHNAGVVHRDIKPANILRSGTYALVCDFGVAKALNAAMGSGGGGMTSTGMAIGTPQYMAPEQLAGDPLADHRIDIYALGLLAYELLNGRSPYAATSPQKVLAAVLTQEPPPLITVRPDVPRGLSDIVMACLAKEPGDRPASARNMLNLLDTLSYGSSGETKTIERRAVTVPGTSSIKTPSTAAPALLTPVGNVPVAPSPAPTTPVSNTPVSNTPVSNAPVSTPVEEQEAVEEEAVPTEDVDGVATTSGEPDGYDPPAKKGKGKLIGGLVVALAIAAAAVFWMNRSPAPAPAAAVPPPATLAVTDSTSVQPPLGGVAPLPGAKTDSVAAGAPKLDSAAIADSIKKVAAAKKAKSDSLRRIAKADSIKKAAANPVASAAPPRKVADANEGKARAAAIAMFADVGAKLAFMDGATHMGGLMKQKRMGDLQTQINAITPFLTRYGLTYDQFKDLAQKSGVNIYDEFGRISPDALRRFSGGQ
jgi:serine/threonine protein kinase